MIIEIKDSHTVFVNNREHINKELVKAYIDEFEDSLLSTIEDNTNYKYQTEQLIDKLKVGLKLGINNFENKE